MSYYYLPTNARLDKIPANYTYISIVEHKRQQPAKGKKYSSSENEDYKKILANIKQSDEMLSSGYFNAHNCPIDLNDVITNTRICDFNTTTIYKIQPIAAKEIHEQYSNRIRYETSEFRVLKKISSLPEFLDQLKADRLLNEYTGEYFNSTRYLNDGYETLNKQFFHMIKERYPDHKIYLGDLVLINPNSYKRERRFKDLYPNILELITYHLDNGLIELKKEFENSEAVFEALMIYGWFDLAYRYLQLPDYYINEIKKNKVVNQIVREHSGDEVIKSIISFLDIGDTFVTLVVKDYDGYIKETTIFNNIDELRTYIIKKYNITYSGAGKEISTISTNEYSFELQ